jgi:hypothetical protein
VNFDFAKLYAAVRTMMSEMSERLSGLADKLVTGAERD